MNSGRGDGDGSVSGTVMNIGNGSCTSFLSSSGFLVVSAFTHERIAGTEVQCFLNNYIECSSSSIHIPIQSDTTFIVVSTSHKGLCLVLNTQKHYLGSSIYEEIAEQIKENKIEFEYCSKVIPVDIIIPPEEDCFSKSIADILNNTITVTTQKANNERNFVPQTSCGQPTESIEMDRKSSDNDNDNDQISYAVWFNQRGQDSALVSQNKNQIKKESAFQIIGQQFQRFNGRVNLGYADWVVIVYQFNDTNSIPWCALSIVPGPKMLFKPNLSVYKITPQKKQSATNRITTNEDSQDSKPNKQKRKRENLFRNITEDKQTQMQLDPVAMYSTTNSITAKKISKLCLRLLQNHPSSPKTITDATAGIGGNTLSFAFYFDAVHSIELDQQRYKMLQHNCQIAVPENIRNRITFYNEDSLNVISTKSTQQIIFVDPPWPEEYRETQQISYKLIKLAGRNLVELCDFMKDYALFAVFKLPRNFNSEELETDLSLVTRMPVCWRYAKMMIIVVDLKTPKQIPLIQTQSQT